MNGEAHAVQNTLELQNRKKLAKIMIYCGASEILQHLQQSLPVLNFLNSSKSSNITAMFTTTGYGAF